MERLSQYIASINEKKAAIFIGAGVSALAGCSNLKEICKMLGEIEEIKEHFKKINLDRSTPREIITDVKGKLVSEEGKRAFDGTMRKGIIYDHNKFEEVYIPFIKKLKYLNPWPPVITTNVDYCLTQSGQFDVLKVYHKLNHMSISNLVGGGVFHIHGYVENVAGQVWDIQAYTKRYRDRKFTSFLRNILANYSVLFLGYGLEDAELRNIMSEAKKHSNNSICHFALFSDDTDKVPDEEVYKELYKIQIIKYGPIKNFVEIISSWIESNFSNASIGNNNQVMFPPSF